MRATTYNNYETLIRLHIKPYIGETKLNKLTTLQIQKLYNRLLTEGRFDRPEAKDQPKGLSGKTVRNIHTVIHSACEKAISPSQEPMSTIFSARAGDRTDSRSTTRSAVFRSMAAYLAEVRLLKCVLDEGALYAAHRATRLAVIIGGRV